MTPNPQRLLADAVLVALDAEYTRQSAAGITRYARSLAAALRRRGDISLLELGGGDVVPRGTLRKRAVTARQDFIWYPWLGRQRAARAGAKVYHVPLPRGPLWKGNPPLVVTVHDLVPLLFPETITPWSRLYARATLRRILDAADRIITPSENTADDLELLLGLSPERIRVVYNGVDDSFFADDARAEMEFVLDTPPATVESDAVRQTVGSNGPYILFVGTPEPRKNLERLLVAVTLARRRGLRERLVIVGDGGWGPSRIDGAEVQRLGRVSDDDLRRLYMSASCLALPSLHEGFGLTALEAMASGTPVVAARVGALPEITAGAAVLVDPLNPDAIADGIIRCIEDGALLSAAGRARAKEFSWERTAAGTTAVYRELA